MEPLSFDGRGRVARVFQGVTTGIVDPGLTAERVAADIAQIDDPGTDFVVPASLGGEIRLLQAALE
jgi:hypothetical protein